MKYFKLIFRNALRNKRRSALTVLSITISLLALTILMNIVTSMEAWEGQAATHHRIVVQSAVALGYPLPIAMHEYLEKQNGAVIVEKLNWFGGHCGDPREFFANFAVDQEPRFFEMWDELHMPADEQQAWLKTKSGVIIGKSLFDRMKGKGHDWKKGGRLTLIGTIYGCNLELDIVGIFTGKTSMDEEAMYFHWDYFDEKNPVKGQVGTYWIKTRGPDDMVALKDKIDGDWANSGDRTETMTEKEFAQQFQQMMGNVKGLVINMGTMIAFVLILVAANTMSMSARERVTEVAVMRTLGFQPGRILFLFLAEALVVSLIGAALAAGIAWTLFNGMKISPFPQFFPYFEVAPKTIAIVIGLGGIVGLVSAAVPAIRSARRGIVEGLRYVG
jgi:putative ABC transport system permease protein